MTAYSPGPLNALTDVEGLTVGHASDPTLKSGVSVVLPDAPAIAGVHIMGGAPGTRETDLLAPDKSVAEVHALALTGGSAFGLDAASGVMTALRDKGIGFAIRGATVPIVPAAVIFDLAGGGDHNWSENPYASLGRQALEAATNDAQIGTVGAGTGARAGHLKGGLGTASLQLPTGETVAAMAVCNALGNTTVGDGPHFWAAPFEIGAEFGGHGPAHSHDLASTFATKQDAQTQGANTTIAVVATDATLTKPEAQRFATAAHDGMARAISPSHTPFDGDLVFALSTAKKPPGNLTTLGHAAAICLSRAIARGVYGAKTKPDDVAPTWATRFGQT